MHRSFLFWSTRLEQEPHAVRPILELVRLQPAALMIHKFDRSLMTRRSRFAGSRPRSLPLSRLLFFPSQDVRKVRRPYSFTGLLTLWDIQQRFARLKR